MTQFHVKHFGHEPVPLQALTSVGDASRPILPLAADLDGRHGGAVGRHHSEFTLTIPFAALSALIAALLETTVLPEIPIAGATADLVLVVAVVATIMFGVEDGIVAAFVGGLLVDMLIPDRPLGAATLSCSCHRRGDPRVEDARPGQAARVGDAGHPPDRRLPRAPRRVLVLTENARSTSSRRSCSSPRS